MQMSFLKAHFGEKRSQKSNLSNNPNDHQLVEPESGDGLSLNAEQATDDVDCTYEENNSISDHFISSPSTNPSQQQPKKKRKLQDSSTSASYVLQSYLDDRKERRKMSSDHLTSYFKAAEDTVRTFNPLLQIEIKSKISALISEYELKNITTYGNCSQWPPNPSPTSSKECYDQAVGQQPILQYTQVDPSLAHFDATI